MNCKKNIIYNKNNNIIVKDFISALIELKKDIEKMVDEDNKNLGTNYDLNYLYNMLPQYKDIKYDSNYEGIGSILCINPCDALVVVDVIIKSILSGSKLLLSTDIELYNTTEFIVELIRQILKSNNVNEDNISMKRLMLFDEILKLSDDIDCIIVNKEFENYRYFIKNTCCKVIYLDYGNINIYTDTDKFDDKIDTIIEECDKRNIDVYLYKVEGDIEEYIKQQPHNFIYNTVLIYTLDVQKSLKFYENIKARNIYINKNPLDTLTVDLDLKELIYKKSILY